MNIIYKMKTDKTFDKAINDLKINLAESSFGVLWELNFRDKFKEKGLTFGSNYQVLEVCNPSMAKEVLEENLEVGFFLPCKIVVYEDNNTVYIGMPRPSALIGMFDDNNLSSLADEVEQILKTIIDKSI